MEAVKRVVRKRQGFEELITLGCSVLFTAGEEL